MSKNKINWKSVIFFIVEFLLLLATASLIWCNMHYGEIDMDSIMFQLFMPAVGTATHVIYSYIIIVSLIVIPIMVLSVIGFVLYKKHKDNIKTKSENNIKIRRFAQKLPWLVCCIWFLTLLLITNTYFGITDWVMNQFTKSTFIEKEYVDPNAVTITFPETKRNLIYIFVESGEASNQDIENGGVWEENYIPEITELMKNNISFSQNEAFVGASVTPSSRWSIAALVTQTSGVPLKMYQTPEKIPNSEYVSFLPGVKSLGEVLEENGYNNYFMAGADFDFGCGTDYLVTHGNYEMFDYHRAIQDGEIPKDYYEWWGFEDQKLFAYAQKKLTEISQNPEPFNFMLMTCDTHCEDGYVCDVCENHYDDQYQNVWRCASKQINDFVNWIKEQSFYENTTIVIIGDHCSMDSDFYKSLDDQSDRTIMNCFINSAIESDVQKNRKFTTLDMYPTILASIGAKIDGNRLGLGVNLFSGEETLSEKYGYDYLFSEIRKKSVFYDTMLLTPTENYGH